MLNSFLILCLFLKGSPKYTGSMQQIISKAKRQMEIYLKNDLDGVLVENMNDIPYVRSKDMRPETIACMARVCAELKRLAPEEFPCGVQILAGANAEALAVSKACDLDFIRAEGFVFSHVADEGLMDACAGNLLRYRQQIGAGNVLVLADIKKKHSSHAITEDISILDCAKAAEFFDADGIILTGKATGEEASQTDLCELKSKVSIPTIIGSGVTRENVSQYASADALIVGSHFKVGGLWQNDIDAKSVEAFMSTVREIVWK